MAKKTTGLKRMTGVNGMMGVKRTTGVNVMTGVERSTGVLGAAVWEPSFFLAVIYQFRPINDVFPLRLRFHAALH